MFNPATLFMYVPVPSQEPVIQWLSFVYVLHIIFSFIFIQPQKLNIFWLYIGIMLALSSLLSKDIWFFAL